MPPKSKKKMFLNYVNALESASVLAREEFIAWWDKADKRDPAAFRDACIEKYTQIAYKYGLLASRAGAQYYKNERDAVLGGDYEPIIPDPVNVEQLESNVKYAMGHFYFGEHVDGTQYERGPRLFDGYDGQGG